MKCGRASPEVLDEKGQEGFRLLLIAEDDPAPCSALAGFGREALAVLAARLLGFSDQEMEDWMAPEVARLVETDWHPDPDVNAICRRAADIDASPSMGL